MSYIRRRWRIIVQSADMRTRVPTEPIITTMYRVVSITVATALKKNAFTGRLSVKLVNEETLSNYHLIVYYAHQSQTSQIGLTSTHYSSNQYLFLSKNSSTARVFAQNYQLGDSSYVELRITTTMLLTHWRICSLST